MRGIRQSVKKRATNVSLKDNIHLAIVAEALGKDTHKKLAKQNNNNPQLIANRTCMCGIVWVCVGIYTYT